MLDIECEWAIWIPDYLEDELSEEDKALFETHLKNCKYCQKELNNYRLLIKRLKEVPPVKPSPQLKEKIFAKISQELSSKPSPFLYKLSSIFAIVCVIIAITFFLHIFQAKKKKISHKVAISRGLHWLSHIQEPDGRWDPKKWNGQSNYTIALTSLCILSFLGDPNISFKKEYNETIKKGITYLLNNQHPIEGYFGKYQAGLMYNHPIATITLLEAYSFKKEAKLKYAIEKALNYICKVQKKTGGWGYIYSPTANTSVSGWNLYALIMAEKLGWKDVNKNIKRGLLWLKGMINLNGDIGYTSPEDFPYGNQTLTIMGYFYLFLSDPNFHKELYLDKFYCKLKKFLEDRNLMTMDYYRNYFLIHFMYAFKIKNKKTYIKKLEDLLFSNQITKGKFAGSWDATDKWGKSGGRLYSTTLAILALEAKTRISRLFSSF